MNLYTIETGFFKLDGGAMFGVVPKSLWSRTTPADENNLCTWAMRCLLVETEGRLILIDTGIGNKQSEKFFSHYYLQDTVTIQQSLAKHGFGLDDITDVFLTHLHFDHVGGAVQYNASKDRLEPVFKNATYWSNEKHWKWATEPNPREKASFLKENIMPIQESGQLKFVDDTEWLKKDIFPGFDALFVNGHTEKQMLPLLHYKGHKVLFSADLIPSANHAPLPYVMGYDMRPLDTLAEKTKLYETAIPENWKLFLEHDAVNELCTIKQTDRGPRLGGTLKLSDL